MDILGLEFNDLLIGCWGHQHFRTIDWAIITHKEWSKIRHSRKIDMNFKVQVSCEGKYECVKKMMIQRIKIPKIR